MLDIKLRFPNQTAYEAAFTALGWVTRDEEGVLLVYPTDHEYTAFVGIPVIKTPGVYNDETGEVIMVPVFEPGFHVDVRVRNNTIPDVFIEYVVTPEHPFHTFF